MYDTNKYGFVEVRIDRHDMVIESLIDDISYLLPVSSFDSNGKVVCRGLLRKKAIQDLETIRCVSPYGAGYDIRIEGFDIDDPRNRRYFWEGYSHWTEIKKNGLG